MSIRTFVILSLAIALAFSLTPMIFYHFTYIPEFIYWTWILMYPLSMILCFFTCFTLLCSYANKRRDQLKTRDAGCKVMEIFAQHQQNMLRASLGICPPVPASPPVLPAPMVSTSAQATEAIKTLHALKSEGLISDDEFDVKKKEIMSRL